MNGTEAVAAAGSVRFRKSSRSGSGGGQCVLVAGCGGAVLVQDSKEDADQTRRRTLAVSRDQFAAFLRGLHTDRFQR
ncbi:DUF397 domain-containing protein [Saccharopolyspora cebuensis]|uniref:DUF397 domain-containing protein n=1 Tax=Saccharopolyspora cebuensis TaxID=418759 RepID=A0ABV4C9Y9_9PSEU